MIILQFILTAIFNTFFNSADPNLFGSRKRRKAKEKLAREIKGMVSEKQEEINALKAINPFESAASKSAMAESARRSKQIANRYANTMGANASPESIIAAQQATQEAVADTAGDIAVGAEANKAAQLAQLRGEKMALQGQYAGTKESSINERGSGWSTLFQGMSALGGIAEGGAKAAGLFI